MTVSSLAIRKKIEPEAVLQTRVSAMDNTQVTCAFQCTLSNRYWAFGGRVPTAVAKTLGQPFSSQLPWNPHFNPDALLCLSVLPELWEGVTGKAGSCPGQTIPLKASI